MNRYTAHRCTACGAQMVVRYVTSPEAGVAFYLRCSSDDCLASGPLAASEITAAAKWLQMTSGTRDITREPTLLDKDAIYAVSSELPTAPHKNPHRVVGPPPIPPKALPRRRTEPTDLQPGSLLKLTSVREEVMSGDYESLMSMF